MICINVHVIVEGVGERHPEVESAGRILTCINIHVIVEGVGERHPEVESAGGY